jgi:hypothetical protein
MTNLKSNKDIFLRISAVLTGKSAATLMATGSAISYFHTLVQKNVPWDITLFLEAASSILDMHHNDPDKIYKIAMHQLVAQSQFNGLGKSFVSFGKQASGLKDLIRCQSRMHRPGPLLNE